MAHVDFHALFNDLAKALDLVDSLPVPFLHLLDDLERLVLLAEYAVQLVATVLALDFHAVVAAAGALDVEGDGAARRLALHAGAVLLEADDALEEEALVLQLVDAHGSLGGNEGAGQPGGAVQVHPLVEGLSGAVCLQLAFVLGDKALVVIRCHSLFFMLVELEVKGFEGEACLLVGFSELRLVVELSHEDH